MFPVIHAYKLRLTNLNQSNRSLKLGMLSTRRDIDITSASFLNKLSAEEILTRIVSGKHVELIRAINPRDEQNNLVDRRLNNIYRELTTLNAESGAYDLWLGYPFVEGKFLEESIARCPVMLFPVRLIRDFEGSNRWKLQMPENETPTFNKTFFLALEKFMQIRLPKAFWDEEFEHFEDIQACLNALYELMQRYEVPINFGSQLFQFKVVPFEEKNAATLDQLPVGALRFQPNAVLGIFPQSDSSLLQDYEQLEKSGLTDPIAQLSAPDIHTPQKQNIREDERFFVTPVDQSQEEAILTVKRGRSVVVHGPPGTGKSQVILNLVADAMAHGKRVLVCSQKRAALDVVFQRLHRLGLGEHAALVHDHRTDRAKLFLQISKLCNQLDEFRAQASDVLMDKWLRDFRMDARKIDELSGYFDSLQAALTTESRFGLSPHELYLSTQLNLQRFPSKTIALKLNHRDLLTLGENLEGLYAYRDLFHPDHPWHQHLSLHTYGIGGKQTLADKIKGLKDEVINLSGLWREVHDLAGRAFEFDAIRGHLQAFGELETALDTDEKVDAVVAFMLDGKNMTPIRKVLSDIDAAAKKLQESEFLVDFPRTLYDDLRIHVQNYQAKKDKFSRWFSLDFLKARWYLARIISGKGKALDPKTWKQLLKEFHALEKLFVIWQENRESNFFQDLPILEDWAALQSWCEMRQSSLDAVKLAKAYAGPQVLSPFAKKHTFDRLRWENAKSIAGKARQYLNAAGATVQTWLKWLHPAQVSKLEHLVADNADLEKTLSHWTSAILQDFESLRDLDIFLQTWAIEPDALLTFLRTPLCQVHTQKEWEKVVAAFKNSVQLDWLEVLETENPILVETTSPRMESNRKQFSAKITERQENAVSLIKARLARHIIDIEEVNRLGNPVTYREIIRQVQKQRRVWTLRKLIQESWQTGLARLVPCWLASPEAVSAIFPMQAGFFDLVIFDEASQCYVERALPVMLRGGTVVVAGDEKQLQPFDLYQVKAEAFEEPFQENEMALEVESALDLGKNVFDATWLRWHYRSRSEALIQFSNQAFYDNRLMMIPPAQPDEAFDPPLDFVRVQGVWQENRNDVEARAVIDIITKLAEKPNPPSIGVVTFNHPQMELIRDMLDQRLGAQGLFVDEKERAALQKAVSKGDGEISEGLFVKNIENVQGDERDVIIFSVGYAKNQQGKLIANFGLLNQRGGENRLNVAVTRAKRKVIVVCSVDPEDLAVEESLHEGPKLLKKYLMYARDHTRPEMQRDQAFNMTSPSKIPSLAQILAAELKAKNIAVHKDIGYTSCKIDLAIKDREGKYVMGLECEGQNYFSSKSSKEREVYRQRLFDQAGWKIKRVWSRSYFLNPKQTIQDILGE